NWYLVACSTARSAGFAPLRMGFRALEDLVDVDRGAARQILVIWPVAHQAALLHVGPDPEYGLQPVLRRKVLISSARGARRYPSKGRRSHFGAEALVRDGRLPVLSPKASFGSASRPA